MWAPTVWTSQRMQAGLNANGSPVSWPAIIQFSKCGPAPATSEQRLSVAQRLRNGAQVLPRHPLVGGRPQQVRRMERRDGADGAGAGVVVEPFSAGPHDALAGRQQRLRR